MQAKSTKKLLITGAVVFLLAIAYGCYLLAKDEEAGEAVVYEELILEQGSASRDLLFRGILQSSRSTPIVVMTEGRITEIAKQGIQVKKGDVLCQVDDSDARESIETQETNLNTTELLLEQLHALYELTEFQENNNIKDCKAKLAHAILEEKKELESPDERERRLMDIEEHLATLDVEDAEDAYQREKRMYEKKYITLSALEPYQHTLENAKATLEELQIKNQITRKGATAERRVELRKAVQRAQANLDRVDLRRKRRLDDIKAQIDSNEKELEVIKFSIKHSQEQIDAAIVRAPEDGLFKLLTYRDWTSGGLLREVTVGDEKHLHDIVGHIIDPSDMVVKLVVNEADFTDLAVGMPVVVTLPSLPDKRYEGKIVQLGAIGKDRNRIDPTVEGGGDSEVTMFNAAIEFKGDGTNFHPGMSALIRVKSKLPQEGLFLPREAIIRDAEGKPCVLTERAGVPVRIEGQDFNEMLFQVESGLKAGDKVFVGRTRQK